MLYLTSAMAVLYVIFDISHGKGGWPTMQYHLLVVLAGNPDITLSWAKSTELFVHINVH